MGRQVATAKSPTAWQRVDGLRSRVAVEFDLADPVLQRRPTGQIRGEKINDLSPLWPESNFKKLMLDGARIFVRQLGAARERYTPVTAESEFRVYGPYRHKPATNGEVLGYFDNRTLFPDTLDFIIKADFVAEFGYVTEAVTEDELASVRQRAVDLWVARERAGGNEV